jgi:hypothetical protein
MPPKQHLENDGIFHFLAKLWTEDFIDSLTTLHYGIDVYYCIIANKADGKASTGTDIHFLIWGDRFLLEKKKKRKNHLVHLHPGSHLLAMLCF